MATRPVFLPQHEGPPYVDRRSVEFKWYPGYAISQKQKSIQSLHESAHTQGISPVLEISTKSPDPLGKALSAFNLKVETESYGRISLESAFQGSKVFDYGGPFVELYGLSGREVKRYEPLRTSGSLIHFDLEGTVWELEPRTAFYDWLYLNSVHADSELAEKLDRYVGFTDIEFNPAKAINCQAFSCALYVALVKRGLIDDALSNRTTFLEVLAGRAEGEGPRDGDEQFLMGF